MKPVLTPTPDLLDTIYACEQRQDWYRDFAEAHRSDAVALVGSLNLNMNVTDAATALRDALEFNLARRVQFSTWTDALAGLRDQAEEAGLLVMINGVVGNNTHRKLNPDEFRGFALVDDLAPLIFVNGSDTKAAQKVHERAVDDSIQDAQQRERTLRSLAVRAKQARSLPPIDRPEDKHPR